MDMPTNYTNHYEDLSTFTSHQTMQSTLHSPTNIPYYHHHQLPILDFTHHSPSLSCNNSSTSDEAEENYMSIINERKRRRMISNRESARRSRMRKQKQLDELCAQLNRLGNQNLGLIKKFDNFLQTHEQVVRENDRLKKEMVEIKQLLADQAQTDKVQEDDESLNRSSVGFTSSGCFNLLS